MLICLVYLAVTRDRVQIVHSLIWAMVSSTKWTNSRIERYVTSCNGFLNDSSSEILC